MSISLDEIKQYINEHDMFAKSSGIRILEVREGYAEAILNVTDDSKNCRGNVHGGAIFTLADAAFACVAHSFGPVFVAQSAGVSFIRPGSGKTLTAKAKSVFRGRRSCVVDVEVFNEKSKLVAKLEITGFCVAESRKEIAL